MGTSIRPLLSILAVLALVASAAPAWAQTGAAVYLVANTGGAGVNFRSSPGGAAVGSWPEGSRMTAAGDTSQAAGRAWRQVQAPDGAVGWVAADYLAPASGSAAAPTSTTVASRATNGLAIGNTEGLNAVLRDAPAGTQIGSYPEGTVMQPLSNDLRSAGGRDWRNVRGPDGKSGWMAAFLLNGGTAGTTASSGSVVSSNPYAGITTDMRTRALAARARAVPSGQRRATTNTITPSTAPAAAPTATPKPEDPKKKKP